MPEFGRCKLTGEYGPFVKAHILPRAFVDKNLDKTSRIEWGERGKKPVLKHTGWYDASLVTKNGESILARYDSDAASILKKHGLIWHAFPPKSTVQRSESFGDWGFELIEVSEIDTHKLRLFFLSLLWRAVASRRPEFREIRLEPIAKEKLRKIVAGEIDGDVADFPVVLLLLTTLGQPQNLTPLRQTISMREFGEALKDIPVYRFFLDGLVAHIGRRALDWKLMKAWDRRVLGHSNNLYMIGRKYEGSFQDENLAFLQSELEQTWPKEASRIYGAL